ncbi:MAG: hypothetical protein AAGC80_23430 [Rhodococcus sp. (in: high G+C Gram-positive bacteria)]
MLVCRPTDGSLNVSDVLPPSRHYIGGEFVGDLLRAGVLNVVTGLTALGRTG